MPGKQRARLVAAAALVALFGPLGFITMSAAAGKYGALEPFFDANRARTFDAIARSGPLLVYLVVALVATVGIAKLLIDALVRRAGTPPRPYYLRAALNGMLAGIGAMVLTSIGMFILSYALGEGPPVLSSDVGGVTLFFAGIVFGLFAGVGIVLLTAPFIVIAGSLFGLAFGWWVRRPAQ